MNEVKLRECPFCGSKKIDVLKHDYNLAALVKFGVVCCDCQSRSSQFFDTEEEAIKAWNTRHEPPIPGGAIVPAGNERLRG